MPLPITLDYRSENEPTKMRQNSSTTLTVRRRASLDQTQTARPQSTVSAVPSPRSPRPSPAWGSGGIGRKARARARAPQEASSLNTKDRKPWWGSSSWRRAACAAAEAPSTGGTHRSPALAAAFEAGSSHVAASPERSPDVGWAWVDGGIRPRRECSARLSKQEACAFKWKFRSLLLLVQDRVHAQNEPSAHSSTSQVRGSGSRRALQVAGIQTKCARRLEGLDLRSQDKTGNFVAPRRLGKFLSSCVFIACVLL